MLDDGNEQSIRGICGNTKMVVALEDEMTLVVGQGGIEMRMLSECRHHRLHKERQERYVHALWGCSCFAPLPYMYQLGNISLVGGGHGYYRIGHPYHGCGNSATQRW